MKGEALASADVWRTDSARSRGTWARHSASAIVAAFAVAAFALVLVATSDGPAVSHDSTVYVAGAQSIAAGDGFKNWDDREISVFPPGFSATLAAGDVLGIDVLDIARWLHALAGAVVVLLTFLVVRGHVVHRFVAAIAAGAVACASANVDVFRHVWSEPGFCVLTMATLLALDRPSAQQARRPALLVAAGVLSSMAFAYRYFGAVLLGAALLVIVLAARRDGVNPLLRRVGLYLIVSAVIPVLIMARNLSTGSGLLGPRRSDSTETFGGVADKLVDTVSRWSAPEDFPAAVRFLVFGAAVALVAVGLVCASKRELRAQRTTRSSLQPTVIVAGAYISGLVVSELTVGFEPIDLRLLAPLFGPTVVLAAVAVDALIEASGRPRRARIIVARIAAAWLMVSVGYSFVYARSWGRSGHIYAVASGRSIVDAIDDIGADAFVVSNLPDSLFIATNRRPVYSSPPRTGTRETVAALLQRVAEHGSGYLVWFDAGTSSRLATPSDLMAGGLHLERIASESDGVLYRIEDGAQWAERTSRHPRRGLCSSGCSLIRRAGSRLDV